MYATRFVMNGIYIYEQTIVQFFVIPSQNCVLNAGKPSRNIFNCNIFVSLLIFRPFSMVEMEKYLINILHSFVIKTTSYSTADYALSRFLVADTLLYKRLCPSAHLSVCPSVHWSVRECESKSGETSILEAFYHNFMYMSVMERGWVGHWV